MLLLLIFVKAFREFGVHVRVANVCNDDADNDNEREINITVTRDVPGVTPYCHKNTILHTCNELNLNL